MPGDGEGAEQQQQADDRVRDHVQPGPEGAAQPGLVDLGPVDEPGLSEVPRGRLVAAAERLEHADAGGRFLHVGGQVSLLVLGQPGQHPVPLLEAQAEHRDRGEQQAGQQPEPPVQPDQQSHDQQEGPGVGDEEHHAEAGEPPDRREVVDGPRQELTGLPRVMKGGLKPLQVMVEIVADGLLDPDYGAGDRPAPEEIESGLERSERDRGQAQRQQVRPDSLDDHVVDDRLGDQGDRDLRAHRQDGGRDHQEQAEVIRPHVLAHPPQRLRRRLHADGLRRSILGGLILIRGMRRRTS